MMLIDGDRIGLIDNDITHDDGICVDVGNIEGGQGGPLGDPAEDFVLDSNRVHDCGVNRPVNELGASGLHGVYVENTQDAQITNNYIFDNMNRGLQLFPAAVDTVVEYNVLDGNSSNLNIGGCWDAADDAGCAQNPRYSSGTMATNNIITNALLKKVTVPGWPVGGDYASVVGYFPAGHPLTNVVNGNCLWFENPAHRQNQYYFDGNGINFDFAMNTFDDPLFVNRTAKDFSLQPNSPCAGKGPQT
jgi:hypothetical protein